MFNQKYWFHYFWNRPNFSPIIQFKVLMFQLSSNELCCFAATVSACMVCTCGSWFSVGEILVALHFDFIQDVHLLLCRERPIKPHLWSTANTIRSLTLCIHDCKSPFPEISTTLGTSSCVLWARPALPQVFDFNLELSIYKKLCEF